MTDEEMEEKGVTSLPGSLREAVDNLEKSELMREVLGDQLDSGAYRSDAGTVTTKVYNIGRDEAAAALARGRSGGGGGCRLRLRRFAKRLLRLQIVIAAHGLLVAIVV